MGHLSVLEKQSNSKSNIMGEDEFTLDLEAFFNLPLSDIMMTSQATSLLSEKISSKANELIRLSKSKLQTALEDLSDNLATPEAEDASDLQRFLELARSVVDNNGQVAFWRDFLLFLPEVFGELDENSQKLCENATTAIMKCHIDPDTLEEHWRHVNLEELFVFHSNNMDFQLFLSFLRASSMQYEVANKQLMFEAIQEASEDYPNITNELLLIHYLDSLFGQDQDLALDIFANFGFIFPLRKLLFLATKHFHHLPSYEEFLEELLLIDELQKHYKLQKALCICLSRKWILDKEGLFNQGNLTSMEKDLPRLLFMKMFSKVDSQEELLEFGLGLMSLCSEKLEFCKQSKFWPGLRK